MRKPFTLERITLIPRPIETVFEFFSQADNLNKITPSTLNFKIVTPMPLEMKKGALIDYKLKLKGIPFSWRTEITEWAPPYSFTDVQIKGPYRQWIHRHVFEAHGNETIMTDIVNYAIPGWFLEPFLHNVFVQGQIKEIFDFRQQMCKEIFK